MPITHLDIVIFEISKRVNKSKSQFRKFNPKIMLYHLWVRENKNDENINFLNFFVFAAYTFDVYLKFQI